MAERRMFAKTIVDSDIFLDMPQTTQNLYFHLNMRADDEGFVNSPKKIMRMVGSNQNDLEILLSKRYLIAFESGVIVIKHWKLHNTIRKDRMKTTLYQEEKAQLTEKENGSYTEAQPNGNQVTDECQRSIVECSIDKYSIVECNREEVKQDSPPSPDPDSNRQRFIEIKNHWKSKRNLPQSKLLDANMSVGHEALDMLKVFPNEDIFKAIDNFDKCFTKIEAKYRIKSFSNFMTIERIELWLSDATVEEYYPKEKSVNQKEIDKIDEFLEIVKTNYSEEQKKPYLEKRERFVKLLEAENG